MPDRAERTPAPGRTLVRRRAVAEIVRAAVLGSYGVTGLSAPNPLGRIPGWLRAGVPGIRVAVDDGLSVDVYVTVAYGLPVAEVARQVDSAIRWSLRRALAEEVGRLSIHVDGMTRGPYSTPGAAGDADTGGKEADDPGAAPAPTSPGADER